MKETEVIAKLDEVQTNLTTLTKAHETLKTAHETTTEDLKKANAARERLDQIVKLSAEDRVAFDTLPVEKQDDFLKADAPARKAMVVAKKDNPTGDPEVQKRFDAIETQNKADIAKRDAENAELRKRLDASEALTEIAKFEKRAGDEFPNLKGTATETGALLRALSKGLSAEDFAKVETLLKSANEAFGKATKALGSDLGGGGTNYDKAKGMAKKMAAEQNISEPIALTKVYEAHPELYVGSAKA